MPSIEQKDPGTNPTESAGGTSSVGTSGLSRNERVMLIILGIVGLSNLILHFLK